MTKKLWVGSCLIFSALILIAYQPVLKVGFYADEYEFLEQVGRSPEHYAHFFLEELPYFRPVQFILVALEYFIFGSAPMGYHLIQILIHLGNTLLLFGIIVRLTPKWQLGFLSSILYTLFPVYSLAVFWPAVADPFSTLFYLLTVYFWILYLQTSRKGYYFLAFGNFVLALLTKEINATLFITLFLVDWLFTQTQVTKPWRLTRRYSALGLVWVGYIIFAIMYQSTRAPAGNPNALPGFAQHALGEVVPYILALAAPWDLDPSVRGLWLVTSLLLFGFFIRTTRSRPLVFLALQGTLIVLPLLPFLGGRGRYLYLPMMISALLWGALGLVTLRLFRRVGQTVVALLLAFMVTANGLTLATAADNYAGVVRQHREPIRVASRLYPKIPNDTLFYFIEPPTQNIFLSGMFFLQYGPNIIVKSTDNNVPADLHNHADALILYSVEDGEIKIQEVEPTTSLIATPTLPANFDAPIRLEHYELASAKLKKGEAIVLLLYWSALGQIEKDYTVFMHLVDQEGELVAGYDNQPREGRAPTRGWKPGELIVDAHVLPLGTNLLSGKYHLEIGLYDPATQERAKIVNGFHDQANANMVIIEPFSIEE